MLIPPIPESPNRPLPPRKSTAAHSSGENFYQHDLDDVSVLSSLTFGTIDSSSISVANGVKRLSRLCGEKVGQDNKVYQSKEEYNHTCSSEAHETSERDYYGDDDTISMAESILHDANEVLSRISSSPFYNRRKKSMGDNYSISDKDDHRCDKDLEGSNEKGGNVSHHLADVDRDVDVQFQAYNCFQGGCLQDENSKPTVTLSNQIKVEKKIWDNDTKYDEIKHGGWRINKLESERRKLQQLLKECQLETHRANQMLQSYRMNHKGNNNSVALS